MIAAASAMPASVTTLPVGSQVPTGIAPSQTLDQNDFLQLLTTQLENQDPLNPISGADFAAQLAEFSTATGVQNLQTGVGGISSQLSAASGLQATGLVGQSVAVSGNALVLGQSGSAMGAFNLSGAAKDVTVTVTDPTGKAVATIDLGAMTAGAQTFSWNGQSSTGSQLPAGTYSFSLNALGPTGAAVTATPYAVVPVTAVVLGGQNGPMLDLGGGLAPVALSAVQQVF